jgi:hypothetical protein
MFLIQELYLLYVFKGRELLNTSVLIIIKNTFVKNYHMKNIIT